MINGTDTSHWQGYPDWVKAKASGRDFAVLKATEGTAYVDPSLAVNRATAHAAGLIVGLYHFARAGNAAAEALYFLRTVGPLQPGEFLVLDQEVPNSVAWCQQWLDAVYKATGVRPFIYMNQSASTGLKLGNWSGVAANYGLWLAVYDQSTVQPSVPYWGAPAMKQHYDKAVVPGIAGPCDVDVFYGTTAQLRAYGYQGADDMPTADEVANAVWAHVIGKSPKGAGPAAASDYVAFIADQSTDARNAVIQGDGVGPGNNTAWLFEQLVPRLVALEDAVAKLQSGAVDPTEVATQVLAGIKAQMSADVTPPAAS